MLHGWWNPGSFPGPSTWEAAEWWRLGWGEALPSQQTHQTAAAEVGGSLEESWANSKCLGMPWPLVMSRTKLHRFGVKYFASEKTLQLGFPEGPPYQSVLRSNSIWSAEVFRRWHYKAVRWSQSALATSQGDVAAQLVHSIQTFLASEAEILSPSEPETCFDVETCRVQNLGVLASEASKASCFLTIWIECGWGPSNFAVCNVFPFTGLGFRNRMAVSYCNQRVSQFVTALWPPVTFRDVPWPPITCRKPCLWGTAQHPSASSALFGRWRSHRSSRSRRRLGAALGNMAKAKQTAAEQ